MLRAAFCIVSVGAALAQSAPDPGDPVLVIHGVCPETKNGRAPADCKVTVTRAQFDDLISVLVHGGQATPAVRANVARTYVETMALAGAARELEMDRSPQYRSRIEWLEIKTLADLMRARLEAQSGDVPEA
jgi:hypothetical protein